MPGTRRKKKPRPSWAATRSDPEIHARAEVLLDRALARHHLDWQTERDRAERAEERRLPPAYFERFFVEAIEHAGGKVERRLDPGTLRVTRTPTFWWPGAGLPERPVASRPTYERLTFDKAVATRPRRDPTETALPQAELCGPGHPLFDALVEDMIGRTATAVTRGAVFIDPDADMPRALRFLAADVVDGNNELVHRSTAAVRLEPGRPPQRSRSQSLYDLALPKAPAAVAELQLPDDDNTVLWARQHVFEERYQDAKTRAGNGR